MSVRRVRWLLAPGRDAAGQSLVEFALTVPIVLIVLLGAVDFTRVYALQIGVQNAARVASEAAIIGSATTDAKIASIARDDLSGVPTYDKTSTVVVVSRTAVGAVCYADIRVYADYQTLVPWPVVPTSARIDRTTRIRDFRAFAAGDADDSEDSQDSQDTETNASGSGSGQGSGSGDSAAASGSNRTNASNPTDCDDSGGSATNSGSTDGSGGSGTEATNTLDSQE